MRLLGPNAPRRRDETFEQFRERMLAETSRFIEWGLQNPDKVHRIPVHRVGTGTFGERLKTLFWNVALRNKNLPD